MNLERALERLRDYRLQNKYFDRLVSNIMANKVAAKAVHASVSAVTSGARARNLKGPVRYETVFFLIGEMRSGTSWLRRTLSAHPEVVCGHEASFFGRDYDHEEITVYPGPVSSFTRALAISDEIRIWHG